MSHKNVAWKNDVAQKNDVNGTKCRTEKRTQCDKRDKKYKTRLKKVEFFVYKLWIKCRIEKRTQ